VLGGIIMANLINGTSGSDTLNGLSGDNTISGGAGVDKLNGGAGLDTLDGGAGSDTLSGNSGDDTLTFDATTPAASLDVYDGGSGKDTLKVVLTFSQWFNPSVQAEVASYLNFVLVNTQWRTLEANNTEFNFTSLGVGLKASKFEYLKVVVDGVDIGDPTDEGVTIVADSMGMSEDAGSAIVNVLANDLVPDLVKNVTFTQPAAYPAKGNVVLEGGPFTPGSTSAFLKYTPVAGAWDFLAAGATGTETFTYTVFDADDDTDTKTVTITITGVNDGPTAVADTAAGTENETLTIDVVANDTDPDTGHVFTLLSGAAPVGKGSTSVVANKLVFDPGTAFDHLKQGATEVVNLAYEMRDEHGATSSSTVVVTVTGTNDGPVAVADTASGHENETLTIDVLANDTDVDDGHVFTLLSVSGPTGQGTVSVVANKVEFDPGTDFDHLKQGATEVVNLTYQMRDEHGATSSSTVAVTVTGTNDGPVAVADTAAGEENETLTIDVLANDTDVDDDHVFTLLSGAAPAGQGSVSVVANKLAFDPGTDFDHLKVGATAVVNLTYQMEDEHGATSSSTVAVTVTGTNDGPVAVADTGSATEAGTSAGSNATGDVLANDTDVDVGDTKTVSAVKFGATTGVVGSGLDGAFGELTLNADGSYSYAVDNDNGAVQALRLFGDTLTDTFTYRVKDGSGAESETTLTITIHGANDAPVFTSGATGGGAENAPISAVVYDAAVTDVDGLAAVFSLSGADAGLFDIDPSTGEVTFKASPNFEAPGDAGGNNVYDVVVNAFDGLATTAQAVAISVTNVNEAPAITSNGAGPTAAISVAENTTAVTTVTATDPDAGPAPIFSIVGGADQLKFSIDATTGALAFVSAPNFEAPGDAGANNTYEVVVRASDGSLDDDQTITVTVTNANEAPTITSNGAGPTAAVSVAENTTAVTTVAATDPDAGPAPTFSIVGGADQLKFSIDPVSGALAFVSAPNFEAPTDAGLNNTYEVQVKASDGALDDVQTITVTVTDVQENAAPTAVADTVIMSAGTNPAIFLAAALLTNDTDPELDALQVVGATGSGVSFNAGTGLITLTDPTITSFTYQMKDAFNAPVTATVTVQKVTIGGGNTDDPVDISGFTYAASYIDSANGADSVTGGGGVDWFLGGSGADLLIGSGADDTLNGQQDNDRLTGNGGADSLMGGPGTDTLTGGAGDDILRGENGSDRFVYTSTGDGADTIQDFSPASAGGQPDRIDLSAIDAIPGGLDDAFAFVAAQNAGTVANSVTWQIVSGNTVVRIDTDGVAGAELTITLVGGLSLTAGDFLL